MWPKVTIKKGRGEPFFFGHPWVFAGAVARAEHGASDGEVVMVTDWQGRFIGYGLYNSRSNIRVRMISWRESEPPGTQLIEARLEEALRLRREILNENETNALRLVNSEGDFLPGLIVDRYGEFLVVQFLSLGMLQFEEVILEFFEARLSPRGLFGRFEAVRESEGIERKDGSLRGEIPPEEIAIKENNLRFHVDVVRGQKTGFYLDQRANRLSVSRYLTGRSVLDCFSYTGAFSIYASAKGGASEVLGIESSAGAIHLATRNAQANALENVSFLKADAREELESLRRKGRKFGAVILDPPNLAPTRLSLGKALVLYRKLNGGAMSVLEKDGLLVSCTCSGHLGAEMLLRTINEAACAEGRKVKVLEKRGAGPDHPVASTCPEGEYLKCLICVVD